MIFYSKETEKLRNDIIYYSVGALLYCPANQIGISNSLINEKFGTQYSLALCLEDTIHDDFVNEAEQILIDSMNKIYDSFKTQPFYLPKIFIRVRSPKQISKIFYTLGSSAEIITGFIIPKFNLDRSKEYINEIISVNEKSKQKIYMMPIYENSNIINPKNRIEILYQLKDQLSNIENLILNIRVGGNDLCHMFGIRRHSNESIHQIKPISHIFSDIITVYGMDYVVSGPVWEYYAGNNWQKGLEKEIKDDQLCGFIGKTVIHPNQIQVVNESYKVSKDDYNDAHSILNWNQNSNSYVASNTTCERMNEYKTHSNWAEKTFYLAKVYGIK